MNLIIRLQVWFRQWRRKRASKGQKTPLREFVYLDEVSVYSLNASRLGSIAAEFTETQTVSLQDEIGSSLGASLGAAKAEVSSRALTSQTHGSQVLRRSIVQTTFKEFYELEVEQDSLVMRPISEDLKPPEIDSLEDLKAAAKTLETDGWIVDPAKLARGQLLEAEVQLEAEDIFQFNAVVSAVLEIVQDDPETFGLDRNEQFDQVSSVNRILEKLLVGLVPVRGCAVDYEVVKLEKREWIVHRKLLNQLANTDLLTTRPLYVVGVAEQSLFWKDIRRVLFSGARFRVLCRMAQGGIQESWTPVKLSHVLRSVAPDLANRIEALGSGALAAMTEASKPDGSTERKQQRMREALVAYGTQLAAHYDHSITAKELAEVGLPSEHHCLSFGSLEEKRKAFNAITKHLVDRFGLPQEPDIAAQYRGAALYDAGLLFSGQVVPLVTSDDVPSSAPEKERFLDSEFVAIYW
jgi:hypothetical protein